MAEVPISSDIPNTCRDTKDPDLRRQCEELSKRLPKGVPAPGTPTPGGGNPSKGFTNIPVPVPRANEGIDGLLRKMVDGLTWNSASLRRSEADLAALRIKLNSP